MRRTLSTLFLVCLLAFTATLSIPLVHATKPTQVSGTIAALGFTVTGMRSADGNTIVILIETESLAGDLTGTMVAEVREMIHASGRVEGQALSTITGSAMGKSGTVVLRYVMTGTYGGTFSGQWVILSGTGDLANLHGQGTVTADTSAGTGTYSGQIHFEP